VSSPAPAPASGDHYGRNIGLFRYVPGRPDWTNFCLSGDCLLWIDFFNCRGGSNFWDTVCHEISRGLSLTKKWRCPTYILGDFFAKLISYVGTRCLCLFLVFASSRL
jgi:hypothetical protein